jgi:DNA polymerase I-like protein with 3'-5' exonuclease and polymerase domains
MKTVLDIECTFQTDEKGKRDPSPLNPLNKLVSIGWQEVDEPGYSLYYSDPDSCKHELQQYLTSTTLLIGHNIKFDLQWLIECGFTYEGDLWDTMLYEYTKAGGVHTPLNLSECCTRYGIETKTDVVKTEYWDKGINTDMVPWDILEEYGRQDVKITKELFDIQYAENLYPEVNKLTNDFCYVLTQMERAGIKINQQELNKIDKKYTKRFKELQQELEILAQDAMGDTPINLNSPNDKCALIYSRRLPSTRKTKWKDTMGLNAKYPQPVKKGTFVRAVRDLLEVEYKTDVKHCSNCTGTGKIAKARKDGTMGAPRFICPECGGAGVIYTKRKEVAGFKCIPLSINATVNGFSTKKETLIELQKVAVGDAKEFLTKMVEYNAIKTYLTSFVAGIRKGIRGQSILHPQFMQAVTATGRLSSRDPNFQNQPRGDTFPIRRVVCSRYMSGKIIEVDFAQLEFRVAVELSGDQQGRRDIDEGTDKHAFTANIIGCSRQEAKAHTFKPLYGGTTGTAEEQAYYAAFEDRHSGITQWHKQLGDAAIKNKEVTLPSGRTYSFPHAKRLPNGGVSSATKIKNYPVQGFATADIVPAVTVEIYHALLGTDAVLINTVHDSVVVDTPEEIVDEVLIRLCKAFDRTKDIIKERFNYNLTIPLAYDIKIGSNWLDMKEIKDVNKYIEQYRQRPWAERPRANSI